jgi:hypothetical protein
MVQPYIQIIDPQALEQVRLIVTGIMASSLIGVAYLYPVYLLLETVCRKSNGIEELENAGSQAMYV